MTRPNTALLAALLLLSSVCHANKPNWGPAATSFMKGRIQVRNNRPMINVRSFGKHYKEQTQWASVSKHSIEFRFDPSLNVGHTSLRVGGNEYQMLGSRAASGDKYVNAQILSESVGAVYRVPAKDIQKIDHGFKRVVESANKYNFPAFSLSGRQLTVAQRSTGWEIQRTKRRAETRMIQAKLIKDGNQEYLQSPNGYRQRVLGKQVGPDGKMTLQVASRSCTSFVTDTLRSLNLSSLPRINSTASARGLANTLMSCSTSNRAMTPDALVHYSVDARMPADLTVAVQKVLTTRSQD